MEEKSESFSKQTNLNISPARSEPRSRSKHSKRSQRAIKEPNLISLSCSKDQSDSNKLYKRSRVSPEGMKKPQNYANFELHNLVQSSQSELCNKCGHESCICLPKLHKNIEKKPLGPVSDSCSLLPKSASIYLLQSIYIGRPSTVLFDYPVQCQKSSRKIARFLKMTEDIENRPLYFKISESVHTYNCLVNALLNAGFTQVCNSSYNIKISGVPTPKLLRKFNQYQKTNHFPGIWQIGRKDNLWRNVYKMRRQFGEHYEICPKTFILPEDYARFQSDIEENPKGLWILKPAASSCGRGIKLINASTHVSKKKCHIVSRYISNPHTINGFKYDLRVYVCVTSFDPLRIYIYKDGLVRFATEKYATNKKTLKQRYVHLTNFSVNKRSDKFVKNVNPQNDGEGSKWSLSALQKVFKEIGIDYEEVFKKVEDVIIKTLIAIEPHIVNTMNQTNKFKNMCFELYGFDILLDSNLKPWLLEVNVCPSLSSSSPLDKKIKTSLMCDVFNLIGIVPFNRKQLDKENENHKISRLLGFEKSKILQRNLFPLQNCKNIEEYQLSEEDLNVLLESDEEAYRTGCFKRIFPIKTNVDFYAEFFSVPRYNNILLWKHLKASSNVLLKYYKQQPQLINI